MSIKRRLSKLEEKLGIMNGQFSIRTAEDARRVRAKIARDMGCDDYEDNQLIAFNKGQDEATRKVHERYRQLKKEGVIVEADEAPLVDFGADPC